MPVDLVPKLWGKSADEMPLMIGCLICSVRRVCEKVLIDGAPHPRSAEGKVL